MGTRQRFWRHAVRGTAGFLQHLVSGTVEGQLPRQAWGPRGTGSLSPEGTPRCVLPSLQGICLADALRGALALVLLQLRPADSLPLRAQRPARDTSHLRDTDARSSETYEHALEKWCSHVLFSLPAASAAETGASSASLCIGARDAPVHLAVTVFTLLKTQDLKTD